MKNSFLPLYITNFFGTLNDNFLKTLASFTVIDWLPDERVKSLYSPAKYALVRDIGSEDRISTGMGGMEGVSFLGVLMGTVAGSVVSDLDVGHQESEGTGPGADFIFAAISPCSVKIPAARSRQPFILFSFAPTKEGERVMRLVHSKWQDARCPSKRKRRVGTLRPTVSLCLFSASLRLCVKNITIRGDRPRGELYARSGATFSPRSQNRLSDVTISSESRRLTDLFINVPACSGTDNRSPIPLRIHQA